MIHSQAAALDGDNVDIDLRIIVAGSSGRFTPKTDLMTTCESAWVESGDSIGSIEGPGLHDEVLASVTGTLVHLVAHPGERLNVGQAVAWIRPGLQASPPPLTVPSVPIRFLGVGASLPQTKVTNTDLSALLKTSDEWIRTRTGIEARHIATVETTTSLAATAGASALLDSGVHASEIDLVVVATATPDSACPSTASRVAEVLEIKSSAFDINGACCGFLHSMQTTAGLIATGAAHTALVVGAERFSTLIDPDDRSTAVLFGDGAGAVVIRQGDATTQAGPGILAMHMNGSPEHVSTLEIPVGSPYLQMDGPELFRLATRSLADSATGALNKAGLKPSDLDVWIPHQANRRIIEAVRTRVGLSEEVTVFDMTDRANTSAASIPLAISSAIENGMLRDRSLVLFSAVGAGLDWVSIVVRWGR